MAAKARAARPLPLFVELLGWLALLSTLALLSPGVTRQASGEPGAAAAATDGPGCSASEAGAERLTRQVEQHIAQLRAQAAARGDASDDEVVVLDNSGFNYRPTLPPPDLLEKLPESR